MKARTMKQRKYKQSAMNRVTSSWAGAMKILQLVSRGSDVEGSDEGLTVLSNFKGNF